MSGTHIVIANQQDDADRYWGKKWRDQIKANVGQTFECVSFQGIKLAFDIGVPVVLPGGRIRMTPSGKEYWPREIQNLIPIPDGKVDEVKQRVEGYSKDRTVVYH